VMTLATVPLLLVSTNRSTDSPSFVLPNGTFTTPALALGLSRLRMESLPLTRASPVLLSYEDQPRKTRKEARSASEHRPLAGASGFFSCLSGLVLFVVCSQRARRRSTTQHRGGWSEPARQCPRISGETHPASSRASPRMGNRAKSDACEIRSARESTA